MGAQAPININVHPPLNKITKKENTNLTGKIIQMKVRRRETFFKKINKKNEKQNVEKQ